MALRQLRKLNIPSALLVKRPDLYAGSKSPDVLFVVDPVVGSADAREAPTVSQPLSSRQFAKLNDTIKEHGLDIKSAAIIAACPPVTKLTWDSDKRLGDAVKLHRETFEKMVKAAKPKLIVALGKAAARQVSNRAVKITKVRGIPVFNEEFQCTFFPTLGINHVSRIPELQRTFDTDFITLGKIIDAGYVSEYQQTIKADYRWATDITKLLRHARKRVMTLSLDTEYTGGEYYHPDSKLLTVQLGTRPGKAYALPIDYNHIRHDAPVVSLRRKYIVGQLKKLLEHPNVRVFGHNLKGDILWLKWKLDIHVKNFVDDTICLAHAVDENMLNKSLDDVTRQFVPEMAGYADQFNAQPIHQKKTRMDLVPPDDMLYYGCGDADATYRAKLALEEELQKDKKAYRCYSTVVMPALRAFALFEDIGFTVDKKALKAFEKALRIHQRSEYRKIIRQIPQTIIDAELKPFERRDRKTGVLIKQASITRAGFLRAMLFTHPDGLELEPKVFTPSTKNLENPADRVPSTSGKTHLAYFKDDHEFVANIMEYIKNEKLLGTYVGTEDGGTISGFYKYIFDGKIRPTYLLHRTVTGRTASANPNGQNFPKRGKLAKEYRKIFAAPPGYVLIEVDFSQLELRVAAILANDPTMLELYRRGADIHAATAAAVMGITLAQFNELPPDVRSLKRFQAKAVNFGFLYGMGWRKFIVYAKTEYGIDYTDEEAQEIRRAFFALYYNLQPWHYAMRDYVKQHGIVRSLDGRVRHLTSVWSNDEAVAAGAERQAINSPVQGFGSDLGLMAIKILVETVPTELAQPIGFIHDAIVCLAPENRAIEAAKAIKRCMETIPLDKMFGLKLPCPIVAEASIGLNLSSTIEVEDKWLNDDNVITFYDLQRAEYNQRLAKWEKSDQVSARPKAPVRRLRRKAAPQPDRRSLVLLRKRRILNLNSSEIKHGSENTKIRKLPRKRRA